MLHLPVVLSHQIPPKSQCQTTTIDTERLSITTPSLSKNINDSRNHQNTKNVQKDSDFENVILYIIMFVYIYIYR